MLPDDLGHRVVRQRLHGDLLALPERQFVAPRLQHLGVLRDDLAVAEGPRHEALHLRLRVLHVPVQILTRGGGESEGRTRDEAPLSG